MAYQNHFRLADEYIVHLDAVMNSIPDPFIKSRYVGFVAVSAVTAYELAIKEIFIAFAEKKHKALESFSRAFFYRINGRIKRDELRKEYIKKFVYDAKFLKPEKLSLNKTLGQGNSLDNLSVIYPGAPYTESYFSGFDKKYGGLDWRSLKFVYKPLDGRLYLIAIIHGQWTI